MFQNRLTSRQLNQVVRFSLAAVLMALPPMQVFAQTPIGVSVVAGAGGGTTSHLTPGTYNQIQQDTTALLSQALDHLKGVQQQDMEYVKAITDRLLSNFKKLQELGNKLTAMSRDSHLRLVPIEEYVTVINQIRAAEQEFNAELQSLTLIDRQTLPSQTFVALGDTKLEAGAAGNINMEPVAGRFSGLRDSLMAELNGLKFPNIQTKNLDPFSVSENALNPNLAGISILSPEEVEQMMGEVPKLLSLGKQAAESKNYYLQVLRSSIRTFVQSYGNDESFRFRDDNDKKAKLEAFANLQDAFMRRSYLRMKYGITLGVLRTTEYKKSFANIENFTTAFKPLNEYLTMIEDQPALLDTEVVQAFENARNFVQQFDERLTPIFSEKAAEKRAEAKAARQATSDGSALSEIKGTLASGIDLITSQFATKKEILANTDKQLEYSSADTGFLVRANSAITFLTGAQPTTEVMLAVMRLILADAREEMMLLRGEQAELKTYHNLRYRSTAESKKERDRKICQIDFTLSEEFHKNNCVSLGIANKSRMATGLQAKSIQAQFQNMLQAMSTVEATKRKKADNMMQLLAANAAAGTAQDSDESFD